MLLIQYAPRSVFTSQTRVCII